MRRALPSVLLALTLAAAAVIPGAQADPGDPNPPSRAEVRDARDEARLAADDVDSIQAALDAANAELANAEIAALQAAEAYNGARYRAQQARIAAQRAERESRRADRALAEQKDSYRGTVLSSYGAGVELDALDGILDADGMSSVIDRSVAADVVQERLDEQRDDYLVAADEADAAEQEAEDTADDAAAAEDRAREAHAAAQSAADAAAAAAASIAGEKEELIRRLARLEGISIDLAEERQAALEAQRLEEEREQLEQEQQDEPDTDDPGDGADEPDAEVPDGDTGDDTDEPAPPADAGAAEAIAFARAQLGEPYVWGAEGPGSWDCSGLTMGAWAAGGIALPHYSVAQYQQSTPISVDDLRPGDLVFWSSSSSSSGIFHVALYTGDGMIIHAPRTGRPVTEESMYYWIPPTHFARP
ncbi:cell wall-associated NlpC family hydrolase [Nocardioides thalensis]|uniref:Cell wall-associated NlpC family hydrolase n=1 Tax=Nocardioides thalensis TaxID=1914755 RepID=A0A853BWJ3_9ACTN|nr:cell wall-associated NlpC family hydrolase [Nocardioides thalensis]